MLREVAIGTIVVLRRQELANEISQSFDGTSTLYALVYRQSDKSIYVTGTADFEAVGTWNDTRAGECDIPMTATGDRYYADFPVVAAGQYHVEIRYQSGGSPDSDDFPIAQGEIIWNGTAEVLSSDITADIADVTADVADLQTDVTTALSNLDNLQALQNRTLNVYTEEAQPSSPSAQIISIK